MPELPRSLIAVKGAAVAVKTKQQALRVYLRVHTVIAGPGGEANVVRSQAEYQTGYDDAGAIFEVGNGCAAQQEFPEESIPSTTKLNTPHMSLSATLFIGHPFQGKSQQKKASHSGNKNRPPKPSHATHALSPLPTTSIKAQPLLSALIPT